MRKKIALVFPTGIKPNAFHGFVLPALGLERLGAHVEDIAEVELFDLRFEPALIAQLVAFQPDLLAICIKTTLYAPANYALVRELREALPGAVIVAGGLHPTAMPEETLQYTDFVIRGEGEIPFRMLVEGAPPETIPGLVFRHDGRVRRNPLGQPCRHLDELRPPARHLRKPHYHYAASSLISMDLLETSRGCTHACTFCSPAWVYPNQWRCHSPEYVMAEIQRLAGAGVEFCMLTDDHFGGDLERVGRICDLVIASGIKIAFFTFIRPFMGRMDIKEKMVRAGFVCVTYGSESPSADQLRHYEKHFPPVPPDTFIGTVNREWHEAGACYVGNSYVFGDPADHPADLETLGVYARNLDASYIEPLYAQPYPGTPYREELLAQGKLLPSDWSRFTEGRMLVRHPELDAEAMKRHRIKTWLDFLSPRRLAMQMRLPLYLHRQVGVSRERTLRFVNVAEQSVFGCLLEDKFYADSYGEMVETWFRETIHTFPPEERDLSENLDAWLELSGQAWIKRRLDNRDLLLYITQGADVLATVVISVRNRQVDAAFMTPGSYGPPGRFIGLALPLRAVKARLVNPGIRTRVTGLLQGLMDNLVFGWVYHRKAVNARPRTAQI